MLHGSKEVILDYAKNETLLTSLDIVKVIRFVQTNYRVYS